MQETKQSSKTEHLALSLLTLHWSIDESDLRGFAVHE